MSCFKKKLNQKFDLPHPPIPLRFLFSPFGRREFFFGLLRPSSYGSLPAHHQMQLALP
jgi:hypothetical protein